MSDKSFNTMQKMKPIVTDTYDFPVLMLLIALRLDSTSSCWRLKNNVK